MVDGSVYFASTKYTCSTAGGCSTSVGTTSYTGNSYLQWTAAQLGSNLDDLYLNGNYIVNCTVPPRVSGTNTSSIISVFTTY